MSTVRVRARRATIPFLIAGALIATGCRPGSGVELGDSTDPDAEPVVALTALQAAVWGAGRAELARTATDGATAVVTTTGVHLVPADGGAPVALHTFAEPTVAGSMAISPDARTLIVTTALPARMLWFDLDSRQLVESLELEPGSSVASLHFLRDGIGVIAASGEGLTAWPDGPLSGPIALTDPGTQLGAIAVLADGRVIAPFANSTTVAVIDGLDVEFRTLDLVDGASVVDAHTTAAGDTLAITVGDGTDRIASEDRIVILDPVTLEIRVDIPVGRALLADLWALGGAYVAAADNTTVDVWTLDGERVASLDDGSARRVDRLVPVDTGLTVVYPNGTATTWESSTWTEQTIRPSEATLVDVAVDDDGHTLTAVDFHGAVERWDTAAGVAVAALDGFAAGRTNGVAIDAEGTRVGAVSGSGRVAVLDQPLTDRWVLRPTSSNVDAIAFRPGSDDFVTGLAERVGDIAFDDTVTSWDPESQSEVFRLGGESEDVAGCSFFYNRLRFTNDGALLAMTSHDFSVSIVDADDGSLVERIPPRASTVLDLAFTPDDDLLVVASDDARVIVLETADYTTVADYQAPMGGYLAIAMLPDSATMAALDLTGTIALVDIMTGERLMEFDDARQRASSIAVSADGTLLAAPAENSAIGVWSVDSGARLATLVGHTAPVSDVEFSPDRTWLASASLDGTVRTWTLDAVT